MADHNLAERAEDALIRETARRFFTEAARPFYDQWKKQGYVDRSLRCQAGELGFLCPMVSKENGGLGGDFLHAHILIEEMARSHCTLPGI